MSRSSDSGGSCLLEYVGSTARVYSFGGVSKGTQRQCSGVELEMLSKEMDERGKPLWKPVKPRSKKKEGGDVA